jgi:hypothetical protein
MAWDRRCSIVLAFGFPALRKGRRSKNPRRGPFGAPFQSAVALLCHIYVVSSRIPQNQYTERVQDGAAFLFLLLMMDVAFASIFPRIKT